MDTESIIESLNLTAGDILTLEKAKDRMEFEALPVMVIEEKASGHCKEYCPCLRQGDFDDCKRFCFIDACDCTGPVGYIPQNDCHPYTVCPGNNCRPVQ